MLEELADYPHDRCPITRLDLAQADGPEAALKRPLAVLYRHAIEGFFGPDDTLMPARGGNAALTDDEVRSAVDYVTALARYYIQQERN